MNPSPPRVDTPDDARVLRVLRRRTAHADTLAALLDLRVAVVRASLRRLRAAGLVEALDCEPVVWRVR